MAVPLRLPETQVKAFGRQQTPSWPLETLTVMQQSGQGPGVLL